VKRLRSSGRLLMWSAVVLALLGTVMALALPSLRVVGSGLFVLGFVVLINELWKRLRSSEKWVQPGARPLRWSFPLMLIMPFLLGAAAMISSMLFYVSLLFYAGIVTMQLVINHRLERNRKNGRIT
jgi:hypothetical protein